MEIMILVILLGSGLIDGEDARYLATTIGDLVNAVFT